METTTALEAENRVLRTKVSLMDQIAATAIRSLKDSASDRLALVAEVHRLQSIEHELRRDLEGLVGELQEVRRHDHETAAWAHGILREVGKAHSDLQRAENAFADVERNTILSEVIEALGRIVDPTSADLGEPE